MKRKVFLLLSIILILAVFTIVGCDSNDSFSESEESIAGSNEFDKPIAEPEGSNSARNNYELIDSEVAEYINYNYEDGHLYIAGLKVFEEFGEINEGSVSFNADENTLRFDITKATGTVTGAVDGPHVFFLMDISTNEIIDKRFSPAPNYVELGITEFYEYSEKVIELTDERMVEIGVYFKELINKIKANTD